MATDRYYLTVTNRITVAIPTYHGSPKPDPSITVDNMEFCSLRSPNRRLLISDYLVAEIFIANSIIIHLPLCLVSPIEECSSTQKAVSPEDSQSRARRWRITHVSLPKSSAALLVRVTHARSLSLWKAVRSTTSIERLLTVRFKTNKRLS